MEQIAPKIGYCLTNWSKKKEPKRKKKMADDDDDDDDLSSYQTKQHLIDGGR